MHIHWLQLVLNNGTHLELAKEQQEILRIRNYINKKLVLGLRPEHLHDASIDPLNSSFNQIETPVEVMKLMGAEIYLHISIGEQPSVARVSSQSEVRMGDMV